MIKKRTQIFQRVAAEQRSREMLITQEEIESRIGKSYVYIFHGESVCRK
jgi:hypothetical protein